MRCNGIVGQDRLTFIGAEKWPRVLTIRKKNRNGTFRILVVGGLALTQNH